MQGEAALCKETSLPKKMCSDGENFPPDSHYICMKNFIIAALLVAALSTYASAGGTVCKWECHGKVCGYYCYPAPDPAPAPAPEPAPIPDTK